MKTTVVVESLSYCKTNVLFQRILQDFKILVSNYTNKHITFNKGEYIGHLELTITDDTKIDDLEPHSANSITLQNMMAEQVKLDVFDPPHHKLKPGIQSRLNTPLKEYETQFAKYETSIGTTPLKNDH